MELLNPQTVPADKVPTEYKKAEADDASSRLRSFLYTEVLTSPSGSASESGTESASNKNDPGRHESAVDVSRKNVQMFALSSNFRGAEIEQHKVVDASSKLDVASIERQIKALSAARSQTTEIATKSLLDDQRKNLVKQLASPFVDRLVLAGLQLEQGKLGEAETTLTDALKVKISPLANDKNLTELRRSAELKRNELTLSRLTPKFLDERFSAIDLNGNNYLRIDELRAARKSPSFLREEKGLLDFLEQNYDMLRNSSDDELFRETSGITKKDVEVYRSLTRPFDFR